MKSQDVLGKRRGGQEEKMKEGKPREVLESSASSLSLSFLPLSLCPRADYKW